MKEYKLGLVLGRFQGVHIGHESIINSALELCSDVLILIGLNLNRIFVNAFSGDYVIENAIKDFGKPDLIIQGIEVKTNTWYKNFQDIHFLEVDREIVPINATKLRGYILEDNKDEFFKYTNPKIHKYYEELRKYLLEVWHA